MNRIGLIGLAAALLCGASAHAANLVSNSDFELDGPGALDIPGWTVTGDNVFDDTTFANSGLHDVAFASIDGDPNIGVLSQDVATTAGQGYNLTFQLLSESGGFADSFTVNFGAFSTVVAGSDAAFSYTPFTFHIDGSAITGATTTLSFQGVSGSPGAGPFNLDDVSLTATSVPEPAAWGLMLTGFLGAGAMLRRRQRPAVASAA